MSNDDIILTKIQFDVLKKKIPSLEERYNTVIKDSDQVLAIKNNPSVIKEFAFNVKNIKTAIDYSHDDYDSPEWWENKEILQYVIDSIETHHNLISDFRVDTSLKLIKFKPAVLSGFRIEYNRDLVVALCKPEWMEFILEHAREISWEEYDLCELVIKYACGHQDAENKLIEVMSKIPEANHLLVHMCLRPLLPKKVLSYLALHADNIDIQPGYEF